MCIFQGGQLRNISAKCESFIFPFLHILMSGRKEGRYQAIYLKLKELSPTLQPQIVMTDYETAILRKLKAIGLQTKYISDHQIKNWDRKFIAMRLLPSSLVQEEVDKLKQEAWRHSDPQIREKMKKFVLYYDRFWMEQKFPELFVPSVHGLRHRTNNVSEALHSKISKSMITHPGFWRFLGKLQRHVS